MRLFKMVSNQTDCSIRTEICIKVLVAEKRKPCEIYRKMCDVYGEVYFSQKLFTNSLNMSFPQQTQVKKDSGNKLTLQKRKSFRCNSE